MKQEKKNLPKNPLHLLLRSVALALALTASLLFALPCFATEGADAGKDSDSAAADLHKDSPLYGKSALFCGDSIWAAAVYDYPDMLRFGWAGRIARDYGMTYQNKGLDGASVSNVRGSNTILAQLQAARGKKYDFVILHGGTNDGWDEAPVGEMTPLDQTSGFDPATFGGGLETLFSYAKKHFSDAKIGFIINYQTPTTAFGTLDDMSAYYDLAKKICDKWEIPYLDLYNDSKINKTVLKVASGRYTKDKIHLNGKGYDQLYPYIAAFMESIAVEEPETDSGANDESSDAVTSEISGESGENAAEEKTPSDRNLLLPFLLSGIGAVAVIAVVAAVLYRGKKAKSEGAKKES